MLERVSQQSKLRAKEDVRSPQKVGLHVLLFLLIGLGLRLIHLDLKPAWMDEVSTVIFSLGNSSYFLPTEQIVDLDHLLQPIRVSSDATIMDSARYLLQENNHPPAYFMLAHIWMHWFSVDGAVASLWISRLFSVLTGSLAIPAIFWVAKNTFRSSLAGVISAALMAVSPFSIFLAQEARHYGLAITLICLSLGFFVTAARRVWIQTSPGWAICLGWSLVNVLAFANHYFSALTFAAQGCVLIAIAARQVRKAGIKILWQRYWYPIYGVAASTLIGILLWLPILLNFYGSPQTTFLRDNESILKWINPAAQTLAGLITSFVTPANFFAQSGLEIAVIVVSILLTLAFISRLFPALVRGADRLSRDSEGRIGLAIIGGFCLAMLGIFGLICYGYGADITRGLRYTFTYYPVYMVLAGGIFAEHWPQRSPTGPLSLSIPIANQRLSGRQIVQVTWLVGLISSLLIVNDFAFPKYYAPDRFIPFVQKHSSNPVLIGSVEKVAEQPTVIGAKFLSIGWEIERNYSPNDAGSEWMTPPQFFALRQGYGVEESLSRSFLDIVQQLSGPTDVWVIHSSQQDLTDLLAQAGPQVCRFSPEAPQGNKGGYTYVHYQCGS